MKAYVPEIGETAADAWDFPTMWSLAAAAEDAAKHFHNHRDGWEMRDFIETIVLTYLDGSEQAYQVQRSVAPVFHAWRKGGV